VGGLYECCQNGVPLSRCDKKRIPTGYPGLNTFLGNGVSGAALTIQSPSALSVPAVGNTWAPSLQGAGTDGKYVVPAGPSKVLEVNGPVTALSPANYHLATTGVLRLAEVP
jgi:hypothetical protein